MKSTIWVAVMALLLISCGGGEQKEVLYVQSDMEASKLEKKLQKYVPVKLTTDLSVLSDNEKKIIPL